LLSSNQQIGLIEQGLAPQTLLLLDRKNWDKYAAQLFHKRLLRP